MGVARQLDEVPCLRGQLLLMWCCTQGSSFRPAAAALLRAASAATAVQLCRMQSGDGGRGPGLRLAFTAGCCTPRLALQYGMGGHSTARSDRTIRLNLVLSARALRAIYWTRIGVWLIVMLELHDTGQVMLSFLGRL